MAVIFFNIHLILGFFYITITLVECLRQYVTHKSSRNKVGRYPCLRHAKNKGNLTMNLKNKQEIIEKFGANAKDTGSAEVQIAMLTKKISELTEHMKSNKKDFATKRGLLMMVGKRKRMLSFLKEKNLEGYRKLIKELGIRG